MGACNDANNASADKTVLSTKIRRVLFRGIVCNTSNGVMEKWRNTTAKKSHLLTTKNLGEKNSLGSRLNNAELNARLTHK